MEGGGSKEYLGEEFENIVMPQYIKGPEDEEFLPVTQLSGTFYECEKLEKAPKIPSTVNMMIGTFSVCSNLKEVSDIPDGVTDMGYCFNGCSSLVEVSNIPDSVTNMFMCFYYCYNLSGTIRIEAENISDVSFLFYGVTNKITVQVPKDSLTYENIVKECGGMSNITIETF